MILAQNARLTYQGEDSSWSDELSLSTDYARSRHYDSTVGRFATLDPHPGVIQQPISLNKYNYTLANPIMGADPSGLLDINLGSLLKTVSITTFLGASVGVVGGAAIGKVSGVGGLRGGYLGALAGASIGFRRLEVKHSP
jgi:RHS repeat-associated protein